jgi:cell division protein ZapB
LNTTPADTPIVRRCDAASCPCEARSVANRPAVDAFHAPTMGASVVLEASAPMSRLPDLADRIERLLLRHEEQKRTNALLEQQLRAVSEERDNLRSRLAAARARVDALIDRLPAAEAAAIAEGASTDGAADANNRSTPA